MAKKPAAKPAKLKEEAPLGGGSVKRVQRPDTWDEIVGQGRAVEILRGAMKSGRVHHAWVFSGPPGVGKFSSARVFACELLKDQGADECVLKQLREGSHPDLHIVTKELAAHSREANVRTSKQTSIAKEVAEEFLLEPALRARVLKADSLVHKVFIVDEAELLNHVTQNTLLKIIEEPPEGTVIILVTSDEHRLLTTIRSRCQRVTFAPLSDQALQHWMLQRGLAVEGPERDWLVAYGAGSPGMIESAVEHGLYSWQVRLDPMFAAVDAGRPGGAFGLGTAMAALVDERAKAATEGVKEASKEAANRAWSRRMLRFAAERTRRQMRGAARSGDMARAERCARQLELISAAERQLESNVRYDQVLESLAALMEESPAVTPGL